MKFKQCIAIKRPVKNFPRPRTSRNGKNLIMLLYADAKAT